MAKKIQKIVIGNWKMNPQTLEEAKKVFVGTRKVATGAKKVVTVVCPPFAYIHDLAKLAKKEIKVGAQDIFYEESGSYTGEVSPYIVGNLGVTHVIIGHSERRALGETDEIIAKKVSATLKAGLVPVICIGEKTRSSEGEHLEVIKNQLLSSLSKLPRKSLSGIIVVYEPVWAVGASAAMSPGDLHEMTIFIRKVLTDAYSADSAKSIAILYGGSVTPKNTLEIVRDGQVDGLLVGRDSLNAVNFGEIISLVNTL